MLHTVFGAIAKVEDQEDGTIKVYGIASSGARDVAGEVVQPDAMKAALPDYTKFPALREMHQPLAAGTVLDAAVNDNGETSIVAHVVDPLAVKKVKTGVYKGFSIGGKVTKRDPGDTSVITGLRLVEISLVDSPCNPDAVLTMWKADMTKPTDYAPPREAVVERAKHLAKAAGQFRFSDFVFEAAQELKAEHIAETLEKADEVEADEPAAEVVETPAPPADETVEEPAAAEATPGPDEDDHAGEGGDEPAAAPEAKAADETVEAAADADAVTSVEETTTPPDPAAALAEALATAKEAATVVEETTTPEAFDPANPAHLAKALAAIQGVKAPEDAPLDILTNERVEKSLYMVGWMARILSDLASLRAAISAEEANEGDDSSAIPDAVRSAVEALGNNLADYAREEVAELVAGISGDGGPVPEVIFVGDDCCFANTLVDTVKADADLMEKAAKRYSKKDADALQQAHDCLAKMGASCAVDKSAEVEQISTLTAENERLSKALTDGAEGVAELTELVKGQATQIAELKKRFEDEPMPPKTAGPGAVVPVTKAADSTGKVEGGDEGDKAITREDFQKAFDALPEAERGQILLRLALARPQLIAPSDR